MWLQESQRNISELAQKMFVKLCSENLPFSGPVDIDGIVCITAGSDSTKQIVVKIHETLGREKGGLKTEATGARVGEPELAREARSPFVRTSSSFVQKEGPHIYTDTPSPNLPKDSHRLQSPEIPHDDNNTLSMSLKIETDSMQSDASTLAEHDDDDDDSHIYASRTPIWNNKQHPISPTMNTETVQKHQVMSSYLVSRSQPLTVADPKLQPANSMPGSSSKTFYNTSKFGGSIAKSASRSGSLLLSSNSSALKSTLAASSASNNANRTKVPVTSGSMPYDGASLSCKFCPGRYQGFKSLQSHLEDEHKRYLCKQCLSTFSMRCNLRRHERLHAGLKPYRCTQCSKSFARSTDLKIHIAKHGSSPTPATLQCMQCPEMFGSSEDMCRHLYSVHKDKDAMMSCNTCGQLFTDAAKLDKHEESHCVTSHLMNGVEYEGSATEEEDSLESNSFELPENLTKTSEQASTSKPEVEDSQNVKSVLQQLLFNSERSHNKRIEARNIIQMEMDDSSLLIDENSHDNEENGAKMTEYDEDAYDNTALHNDTSDHALSTSSLSPSTTSRSSTPKRNRRKKGKPVKVICTEEQDENENELYDDEQLIEEIEDMTAIEDGGEGSMRMSMSPAQFDIHDLNQGMTSALKPEPESFSEEGYQSSLQFENEQSPRALDLTTAHHTASNSLSMLQQLIPKTETPPERRRASTLARLLPKTEAMQQQAAEKDLPIIVPSPKARSRTNGTASPSSASKVKKLTNSPTPIDPDDLVYREYTCHSPGCTVKLTSFRDYDEHSVGEHLRYPCKLCRSSFTGRNNRTRHMRHHHGGSKSHICSDCGKSFARSDSLREHQYIHTKSYHDQKCHNCGIRCEKKVLLLAHLKKCYGKSRSSKASLVTPDKKVPVSVVKGN